MPRIDDLPDINKLPLPGPIKGMLRKIGAHEHHEPILVTQPQGTQANGVDFQHEDRDVNIGAIFRYFAYLWVGIAVTFVICAGVFFGVLELDRSLDRPASPLYTERVQPPLPRLLPNPVDHPVSAHPLPTPIDIYQTELKQENARLEAIGLHDPKTGLATIPEDVVAELASPAHSDNGGVVEMMPSGSSGGHSMENRLR